MFPVGPSFLLQTWPLLPKFLLDDCLGKLQLEKGELSSAKGW